VIELEWGMKMVKNSRKARDVYAGFNVLRTESDADMAKMLADISEGIGPVDVFERIYVRDVAFYNWEMMRYQRIISATLNNALRRALERILQRILIPYSIFMKPEIFVESRKSSERLSHGWLIDPEDQRRVSALLKESGFDGSAIEAEAYTMVSDQLEIAHRMLKINEEGRERALRSLAKYRKRLAADVRRNANRILAADQAPAIANPTVN
jgi:hypothetical protein